ncbi:MAG: glutaredoxin family protein [SAR202 cluster bacterium]|mgnify:CR=1 FL=1|nr:glutaredoxin family protein [SAR202 cluster bacterium]|tara:strand:- start:1117 stop:1335 length:219 start_codon:yes stop_codon:yes gene_type:complete
MNDTIFLYTRPDCTYSDALKSDLNDQSIDFEEIDLSINPEKIPDLEKLTGGERITPVLVNGDTVQVGYYGVG